MSQSTTVREQDRAALTGSEGVMGSAVVTTAPDIRTVLDHCIESPPAPAAGVLSDQDAVWPQRLRRTLRGRLPQWGCESLVESAELLLTELVTNALQHAGGRGFLRVRVELRGSLCRIEVNDGSPQRPKPREATPSDESGRGLLLVDAISDSWGVSEDGTTTWCTLVNEGPVMEPVAEVVHETALPLPPNASAAEVARVSARTLLTITAWPGPVDVAVDVLYVLVQNAVRHGLTKGSSGRRLEAWLRINERHELFIDVQDHTCDFPRFEQAVRGELGRGGLWGAQRLGAVLSWFPAEHGKTVRAILQPGPVDL
ncbi:ATP-binding protein [Streptomyces gardneri]|uniref:ATP-binding protein n=1 Tax=Streptomyces gardneri TaxID=66892 RepID=UPI0035DBF86D